MPPVPAGSEEGPQDYLLLRLKVSKNKKKSWKQRNALVQVGAEIIEPDVHEPRTGYIKVIVRKNDLEKLESLRRMGIPLEEQISV